MEPDPTLLTTLPNYQDLCALLSGARNATDGISPVEVQHLCWLGANLPVPGNVVEVGSHRGKSICCIASGILHAGKAATSRVHCVDLWTLGEGKTFAHYSAAETWRLFQEQVRSVGAAELVRPVMMDSRAAAQKRKRPIHLLFIDAGHAYKAVHADWEAWKGFVAVGGRVAFHDYGTRFPGVDRVVEQEVLGSGAYRALGVFGRIWTGERTR